MTAAEKIYTNSSKTILEIFFFPFTYGTLINLLNSEYILSSNDPRTNQKRWSCQQCNTKTKKKQMRSSRSVLWYELEMFYERSLKRPHDVLWEDLESTFMGRPWGRLWYQTSPPFKFSDIEWRRLSAYPTHNYIILRAVQFWYVHLYEEIPSCWKFCVIHIFYLCKAGVMRR